MQEKDSRVRPVFLDKTGIFAKSLNRGLKEAKGRFIARIDRETNSIPISWRFKWNICFNIQCGACFTLVDLIDGKGTVINDKEKNCLSAVSALIGLKLSGSVFYSLRQLPSLSLQLYSQIDYRSRILLIWR